MSIQLAIHDFGCRGRDGVRQVLVEPAELEVGQRRGLLDLGHGTDERPGHVFIADLEVLPRSLRLGAPIPVACDLYGPKGVRLSPRLHGGLGTVS